MGEQTTGRVEPTTDELLNPSPNENAIAFHNLRNLTKLTAKYLK
jgi:hypothetical protein